VRLFVCMCTFHRVQSSAHCKFATLNASSTRALIRAMMRCGIVAVYCDATIPSCVAAPNVEKRQRCVRNVVLLQQVENFPSDVDWFIHGPLSLLAVCWSCSKHIVQKRVREQRFKFTKLIALRCGLLTNV